MMFSCLAQLWQWFMTNLHWLVGVMDRHQGFCMVVLTLLLALCAWQSCKYAAKNIKAMKELETERSRPQVVLEIVQTIPFYGVRMVNLGLTAARSITVEVTPKLTFCFDTWRGRPISFLEHEVEWLAPRASHQTNIGSYQHIEQVNKTLVYRGFVNYKGTDGRTYREPFVIDFSLYKDTVYSGKKTLNEVGVELEKIRRAIELFGSGFHKLRVIAQSLSDYREEEAAFIAEAEKRLNERQGNADCGDASVPKGTTASVGGKCDVQVKA